jgi:hypothetical protein
VTQCQRKWDAHFGTKQGTQEQLNCCAAKKKCDCIATVCKQGSAPAGCPPTGACKTPANCESAISSVQCDSLPDAPASGETSEFNYLWLLIAAAIIMILCVCVAIFCVYQKKFSGEADSAKDRKHARLTFAGSMNVSSKVRWTGKSKRGSRRSGRSAGSKASGSKKSNSKKKRSSAARSSKSKASSSKVGSSKRASSASRQAASASKAASQAASGSAK